MKKYFVVSDIHSFYVELKEALWQAGFRKTNKDHILIVCGDIFDRGPDTLAVYKFLKSLPKSRCILIKGNHESLYFELLDKSYPDQYDFSNHTVDTFCQIACKPLETVDDWSEIVECVKNHEITKWLQSKQWVDYYELDKYIFVHSFIPTRAKEEFDDITALLRYYTKSQLKASLFEYNPEWRKASTFEWEEARWGDPIRQYKNGDFAPEAEKGKTLVVGHWHTGDFYKRISNVISYISPIHDIWRHEDLIALDGGVFRNAYGLVHPQNVLVLKETDMSVCYDKYGNIIEVVEDLPEYDSYYSIETVTEGQ